MSLIRLIFPAFLFSLSATLNGISFASNSIWSAAALVSITTSTQSDRQRAHIYSQRIIAPIVVCPSSFLSLSIYLSIFVAGSASELAGLKCNVPVSSRTKNACASSQRAEFFIFAKIISGFDLTSMSACALNSLPAAARRRPDEEMNRVLVSR